MHAAHAAAGMSSKRSTPALASHLSGVPSGRLTTASSRTSSAICSGVASASGLCSRSRLEAIAQREGLDPAALDGHDAPRRSRRFGRPRLHPEDQVEDVGQPLPAIERRAQLSQVLAVLGLGVRRHNDVHVEPHDEVHHAFHGGVRDAVVPSELGPDFCLGPLQHVVIDRGDRVDD